MSGYVESVLADGETIVHRAAISHWQYGWYYFLGVCFILGGVGVYVLTGGQQSPGAVFIAVPVCVGVLLIVIALIKRMTTELVLTSRRIITKRGLIARDTLEMNLAKVESVRVNQGLLGRILNYGDVTVVGTGASPEPLRGIARPLELRKKLGEVIHLPQAGG